MIDSGMTFLTAFAPRPAWIVGEASLWDRLWFRDQVDSGTFAAPTDAVFFFIFWVSLAFFVLLAWVGYSILEILATDQLVSLPEVSVAYVNSVIPISSVLFVVGQMLVFPEVLREARGVEEPA